MKQHFICIPDKPPVMTIYELVSFLYCRGHSLFWRNINIQVNKFYFFIAISNVLFIVWFLVLAKKHLEEVTICCFLNFRVFFFLNWYLTLTRKMTLTDKMVLVPWYHISKMFWYATLVSCVVEERGRCGPQHDGVVPDCSDDDVIVVLGIKTSNRYTNNDIKSDVHYF